MAERLQVIVFLEPSADLTEEMLVQLTATLNVIVRKFGTVSAITVSQVIGAVMQPNDPPPPAGAKARAVFRVPDRETEH